MADSRIFFSSQPLLPIDNHSNHAASARSRTTGTAGSQSFAKIYEDARNQVSFSQHALERMRTRNLNLSDQDLAKLDQTVDAMSRKGARESLIYLSGIALVVSVANRTVITAMDGSQAKENIFTNIDSAAIL